MNRFETKDFQEAQDKVEELKKNPRHSIDAYRLEDGTYRITWLERGTYIAQDGKEYDEEVWVTKDGDLYQIKDLSPEHAKNIIRMMLRNDRENQAIRERFAKNLQAALSEIYDSVEYPDNAVEEAEVVDPYGEDRKESLKGLSISEDSFYVPGTNKIQ